MLLPDPASSYVNNVKLRPGVRPLLSFNSHWDVQNQGAYPEAKNDTADVKVTGGGKELIVSWVGKHEKERFATKSTMTVGWDAQRAVYAYDVESELEVLPGGRSTSSTGSTSSTTPRSTPSTGSTSCFSKKDGTLNRRPVYPVDPGPQNDLEASRGAAGVARPAQRPGPGVPGGRVPGPRRRQPEAEHGRLRGVLRHRGELPGRDAQGRREGAASATATPAIPRTRPRSCSRTRRPTTARRSTPTTTSSSPSGRRSPSPSSPR